MKVDRNREIKALHKEHPELSLQEIGDKFNVTRQCISIILNKKYAWRK
jgi:predicted DNA-binding protein YlxM (UPF0122 family)